MAVPVPIQLSIKPPPIGTTIQSLGQLAQLIASSLSGQINASLLTGQVGGAQPASNIGPWLNGTEWYVWEAGLGYVPSEQGCPVGTVAMWPSNNPAPGWLLCNGSGISTTTYGRLFRAIGYTWGGGGGTFNLPPSAFFFFNAVGFSAPNVRGGSQQAPLFSAAMLPPLRITIPYLQNNSIDGGGVNAESVQPGATAGGLGYNYPVRLEGNQPNKNSPTGQPPVGQNPQPVPIMPPYACTNFVIRYV